MIRAKGGRGQRAEGGAPQNIEHPMANDEMDRVHIDLAIVS